MSRGPLIPTLALVAGIALSYASSLSWWWGAIPIGLAMAVYLWLMCASSDPVSAFRMGKWHISWILLLFLGIGMTDESLSRPVAIEKAFGGFVPDSLYCEVTGVLVKTYGERIDVIIDGTNGAKARIRSGVTEISPGDLLRIPSRSLKETEGDTTEIGQRLLPMFKATGILYSGRIKSENITIIGKSRTPRYYFFALREKIEIALERSGLQKSTSEFLNAILMGDKTGLDPTVRMTFANGGMAHMLALSGLHIGILAGFLIFLMWPLKLAGQYKWGYAVAILLLWIYVVLTGMAYSSVRACIMTSFAFIGIISERKNFVGNALSSACMLILIADPQALFDAGFQLSVVCVGSLIAFVSRLNPISHRHHPMLYYICGAIIATIVATSASWALISYYFSQIPLMFLPSNLLLLPILPFYISFAVVFLLLLFFGCEIIWMEYVLDHGYDLLLRSVEWLSCGSEFVIEYQIPLWGAGLLMFMLAAGAYAINRKEPK
ncbi:MAG: ComEC/Rec2 family competence protein [Muribaculaceae bacterium]|nr:ComEC/Rec2 family competence protein [Muribaculaceae bacterium]